MKQMMKQVTTSVPDYNFFDKKILYSLFFNGNLDGYCLGYPEGKK